MWLKALKSMPSVSVGGIEYKVDKSGIVEVPDEVGKELLGHGLTPVSVSDVKNVKDRAVGEMPAAGKGEA